MNNTVLIAGNGKLADSILDGLPRQLSEYKFDSWENHKKYSEDKLVIIHIGSGRQLAEVISFCEGNEVPLIQASTGMSIERKDFGFTFIDAPNLNILMLKFMYMLKEYGFLYKDYDVSITESHQHSKKSVAGTAVELASSIGLDSAEIKSIRDQEEQENVYGIPKESLMLHAYHDIRIQDADTSINFQTLVTGHESYISGLSAVIPCLENLESRYYHILELIELKMI